MIPFCIHGKPISEPSVRKECELCFELARLETLRWWWRVRYDQRTGERK